MTLPVFTSSASGTMSTARQWPDGMRTASPGTSPWARKVIIALSVCGAMPYWRLAASFFGGGGGEGGGGSRGAQKKFEKNAGRVRRPPPPRGEHGAAGVPPPPIFLQRFFYTGPDSLP